MSQFVFPFNFKPFTTVQRQNSNYTVPAGQYGFVSYGVGTLAGINGGTTDSAHLSGGFWVKEGDTLDISRNGHSGVVANPFCQIDHNGVAVCRTEVNVPTATYSNANGQYTIAIFVAS